MILKTKHSKHSKFDTQVSNNDDRKILKLFVFHSKNCFCRNRKHV